jgi:hypothetical protein
MSQPYNRFSQSYSGSDSGCIQKGVEYTCQDCPYPDCIRHRDKGELRSQATSLLRRNLAQAEVARRLMLSESTVRTWRRQGMIG